jgi:PERQ amino acid-rich with GYF domain-containing protein
LGAPRYKLAKHRYGREEMLALYDKTMKAPDELAVSPPLYSEKTQTPLALIQMSDEEMVKQADTDSVSHCFVTANGFEFLSVCSACGKEESTVTLF